MKNLITNQNYLDDDIVVEKIKNKDFEVQVSPEFVIDGETFRLLVDGHHSYHAAVKAGVEPEYIELTSLEDDTISLLDDGDPTTYLSHHQNNAGHWLYVHSGQFVW